jgi:hypothetical protein
MLKKSLILILLFFTLKTYAQTDTLRSQPARKAVVVRDSLLRGRHQVHPVRDSVTRDSMPVKQPAKQTVHTPSWGHDTAYRKLYRNLYPAGKVRPVFMITSMRQPTNKDELFYILTGLLFLVALIRSGFPKYFQNIFRLFFQSNYRQKQSRESLLQDNLPSLLLNIAFLLSGGLLIAMLAENSPQVAQFPFWLLWLYTFGTLSVIYIGKYLFISLCGWAFNVPQFAFNYNFIVFLINKVTGIFLLPLLAIMAFSNGQMYDAAVTVALSLVLIMLLYRYIVALSTVVKNLKISAVHFFIYLCAVEILPLLIIYKLLFIVIK